MKKELSQAELHQLLKEQLIQIILDLRGEILKLREDLVNLKEEVARSKKARSGLR